MHAQIKTRGKDSNHHYLRSQKPVPGVQLVKRSAVVEKRGSLELVATRPKPLPPVLARPLLSRRLHSGLFAEGREQATLKEI